MNDNETYLDMFNFACGQLLGEGVSRKTFVCRFNDSFVLKVETPQVWRGFDNVREWEFWRDNQGNKAITKWLCPCQTLSPDGRILMQHRAQPLPSDYVMPEKIPEFLTDLKRENFGLYRGKLVCVDYALTIIKVSAKLTKAKWRD